MNLRNQQLHRLFDIMPRFGACLHILKSILFGAYYRLLSRHLSLPIQIGLRGNQYLADFTRRVCFDLVHPSLNILERISINYRKSKNYSSGAFVVGLGDIFESLLASCVPNLQFIPPVVDRNSFDFEIDTDGCHIGIFEGVLTKTSNQVGFAYP